MDKAQTIQKEAQELIGKMISKFEISVQPEGEVYYVTVKTDEEASTIIGRHGETIRAIQKILEVILYRSAGESINVLVNVNDYREKQHEKLEQLATELAEKTVNSLKPIHYRGLSSYERKIVHEFITANHPNLTTYSIGEGRDRHLVVDKKKDEEGTTEESSEEPVV